MFGGLGSEIVAIINEKCFEYLDAPVRLVCRIGYINSFFYTIGKKNYMANSRLDSLIEEILKY